MADSLKAAKSKKKRTYLDTGVLFAAFRGEPSARIRALTILSDPDRDFVASDYLMLETSPKAIYQRNISEKEFYERYFDSTVEWAHASRKLMKLAYDEAISFGLAALDALHIAAAKTCGAIEIITTEAPTKPIYRTQGISIVHPLSL